MKLCYDFSLQKCFNFLWVYIRIKALFSQKDERYPIFDKEISINIDVAVLH